MPRKRKLSCPSAKTMGKDKNRMRKKSRGQDGVQHDEKRFGEEGWQKTVELNNVRRGHNEKFAKYVSPCVVSPPSSLVATEPLTDSKSFALTADTSNSC